MKGPMPPDTTWLQLKAAAQNLRHQTGSSISDRIVTDLYAQAEAIAAKVITRTQSAHCLEKKVDDILTSSLWGYPIMLGLLTLVFWLTLEGANFFSDYLGSYLFAFQDVLSLWFQQFGTPTWLHGIVVLGMYRTMAWVVSVMLPPMAIFFPLFTILEDLGYLPRIAFNMDHTFRKCKTCGKQILTMCMGFGCNAAGVVACRIIDSPRERIIAMITNNFVPCNGRFPTFIALSTLFIGTALAPGQATIVASFVITGLVLGGIVTTFIVSRFLSQTLLKGEPSSLVLELPPYRRPQIGPILYRSFLDRTFFVLRRAVMMAAPAGAMIWLLANWNIGNMNLLNQATLLLDPLGRAIGMDGYILLAFILGLPANEIVIPVLLMAYLSTGQLIDFTSLEELGKVLTDHGWTWLTALNMMLFSLLHWPCTTTILSIYKESASFKWTFAAVLIPTVLAFTVCFLVTQFSKLFY